MGGRADGREGRDPAKSYDGWQRMIEFLQKW